MTKTPAKLTTSCLYTVCLLLGLQGMARAETIAVGTPYAGPVKLEAPSEGVSFTLPAGWRGALPAGSEYFVMEATSGQSVVFAGTKELTASSARTLMSQNIPLDTGATLLPKDRVTKAGSHLRANYSVQGAAHLEAAVEAVLGPHGQSVVFLGIARAGHRVERDVARLAKTVRIRKKTPAQLPGAHSPNDKRWQRELVGKKITRFYTGSGYSEKESLWLCGNGRFYRQFNAGGFTPGMASGAVQSKYKGRWSVSGQQLVLRYDDSSTGSYALTYGNKGIELNRRRWYRETANCH